MTQVRLQDPGIGPPVRQHIACRVAKHVRMDLKGHLGFHPGALHHLLQAGHGERRAARATREMTAMVANSTERTS